MNEQFQNNENGKPSEPSAAFLTLGIAALVFGFVIPIVGIVLAVVILVRLSSLQKQGVWTPRMHTTRNLAIVALFVAAATVIISAVLQMRAGVTTSGLTLFL